MPYWIYDFSIQLTLSLRSSLFYGHSVVTDRSLSRSEEEMLLNTPASLTLDIIIVFEVFSTTKNLKTLMGR